MGKAWLPGWRASRNRAVCAVNFFSHRRSRLSAFLIRSVHVGLQCIDQVSNSPDAASAVAPPPMIPPFRAELPARPHGTGHAHAAHVAVAVRISGSVSEMPVRRYGQAESSSSLPIA